MICPKCGFEQPENPECMRCGIVISRYKGPVLGGSPFPAAQTSAQIGGYPPPPPAGYPPPRPASAPPPPPPGYGAAPPPAPQFGNETMRIDTFPPPAPVMNAVGTVYGDPVPAVAGGGTVYGGPMPAGAAAGGTVYGGPVHGGPSAPTFGAQPAFRGTFEIGKVLGEAFSVYFKNFIPFAILTAIAMAPLYLASSYSTAAAAKAPMNTPADVAPLLMALLPMFLGSILCPYIATAAITYGVFQQMKKVDVSIGECLGQGLATLLPVLGVAIVQSIGVFLGSMLCLVPGILLMLRWAVSVPAAVTERPGVGDALRRSTILTEGYRGEVFGILFVMGFLNIGSTMLVTLALADNQVAFLAVSGVKDILTVGLSATSTAVMYYRLRSVKESIDVDEISSVFD